MTSNTEAGSSPGPKNRARPVLVGVSIVAVIGLAASVWFGIGWKNAYDEKNIADIRDSALADAQQAAINLSSVDSSKLDESLDTMLTSVTGSEMTDYLDQTRASITDEQRNSGRKITADLLGSTLTELNTDDRTATVLAIVANSTTNEADASVVERTRQVMRMYLQEIDGVWKVNKLLPVGERVPLDPDNSPVYPGTTEADPNATADPNAVPPTSDATPAPGATGGP